MTDTELRKAVARGQGRAILFLRKLEGEGYRDLILRLCCRDQAFDPWFESRYDYMCRLVGTLPNPLDLVQPLGERLFRSRNARDRKQIRYILAHLYRSGSAQARELLLKDFKRFRLADEQFKRAMDFLGFEGLELTLGQEHRLDDCDIKRAFDDAVDQFGGELVIEAFNRHLGSRAAIAFKRDIKKRTKKPKNLSRPQIGSSVFVKEATLTTDFGVERAKKTVRSSPGWD